MKNTQLTAINAETKEEFTINWDDLTSGTINNKAFSADIKKINDRTFHVIKNNKSYNVEILNAKPNEKQYFIKVNGEKFKFELKDQFDKLLKELGLENLTSTKISEIKAPMPGIVLAIEATVGQEVNKGDTLLILEAMKMENAIKSPTEGVIKEICVKQGLPVDKNQILIRFE
jgi:biotin carboxyl carrier protein